MSPNNPGNFVNDLVEMASAFKRLPEVEAELAEARREAAKAMDTIQRLEHKLLDRSNEITEHLSRIRSLEVERDDAQFHALEADDRTQRALDFIKATFGNAGALIQALEPPAPPKSEPAAPEVPVQPVQPAAPMTNPVYSDPNGQFLSTDDGKPEPNIPEAAQGAPLGESQTPMTSGSPSTTAHDGTHSSADASPAPEVAQPGEPTGTDAAPTASPTPSGATDASGTSATEPGGFSMKPIERPYAGKRYSEVVKDGKHWPTRDQWEAGGGTVDNWYA
jgi:hypothetical protein